MGSGRGGGDRRGVVPDTGRDAARRGAERCPDRIAAAAFQVPRGTCAIDVTVSFGVASRQPGDNDPAQMLKRADLALYQAKQSGRNRVVAAAA